MEVAMTGFECTNNDRPKMEMCKVMISKSIFMNLFFFFFLMSTLAGLPMHYTVKSFWTPDFLNVPFHLVPLVYLFIHKGIYKGQKLILGEDAWGISAFQFIPKVLNENRVEFRTLCRSLIPFLCTGNKLGKAQV